MSDAQISFIAAGVLRLAATLVAFYRLFGVSLAGGGSMLLPSLPATCLLVLAATPVTVIRFGFIPLCLALAVPLLGLAVVAREVLHYGFNGYLLIEGAVLVAFIAYFVYAANSSFKRRRAAARGLT